MNIQGKVIEIFDTQKISDTFKKREFVVEYAENPQYPELIKFECIQEKCDLLDSINKGDTVDVQFNLKGRKWTDPQGVDKYFTSLQAWRIDAAGNSSAPPPGMGGIENYQGPETIEGEDEDELPF